MNHTSCQVCVKIFNHFVIFVNKLRSLNTNLTNIKFTETKGSNYCVRKYIHNGYIECFGLADVVTDFSFNQIGTTGIYWSAISNINIHASISKLLYAHANICNTGVIFSGNFYIGDNGALYGQVLQYGNTQRDTTVCYHVIGLA